MKLPTYQELSKEQDEINNLPLEDSFLVTGPPGTGKTVMALYRTEMLTSKAAEVRLLMYSRLLSNYVRSAVDELDLDGHASTFHSWIYGFYQACYRQKLPERSKYNPDWEAVLTKINVSPPTKGSLPFLIVDEGQDLPPQFFFLARYLARHLTVFADENQKLMDDNSTLSEIKTNAGITTPTYALTRNYRNTREIAELACCFYTGLPTGVPDLPTRQGEKPELLHFDNLNGTVEFIARYERNNDDLEIGVFTPTKRLQTKFVNRLAGKTKNPVQHYDSDEKQELDFDTPGIKVVNYKSAKGLEFDTVFLPELQQLQDDTAGAAVKMRFYVLVSRARDNLFLTYSGDERPAMLDLFPSELVEET